MSEDRDAALRDIENDKELGEYAIWYDTYYLQPYKPLGTTPELKEKDNESLKVSKELLKRIHEVTTSLYPDSADK